MNNQPMESEAQQARQLVYVYGLCIPIRQVAAPFCRWRAN